METAKSALISFRESNLRDYDSTGCNLIRNVQIDISILKCAQYVAQLLLSIESDLNCDSSYLILVLVDSYLILVTWYWS